MDWLKILTSLSTLINTSVEENMIYYDKSSMIDNWLGFQKASELFKVDHLKYHTNIGMD